MAYGIDRWFMPVVIEEGVNDEVILRENGADYTITVPPGTYWTYTAASSGFQLPGYPSLYITISGLMTAAVGGGNSYFFQAANPSGTALTDYRSMILTRNVGSNDFSLRFSQSGFTLDKRLFGVGPNHAADISNSGASTPATGQVWGQWVSPRPASDKRSFVQKKVVLSTEDTARSDLYAMKWEERRRRMFIYHRVPAAWVHQKRAEQADYAEVAGISTSDTRMAFEHLWAELSAFNDIIVVHNQGDDSDVINNFENVRDNHEIVRLLNVDEALDFENIAEMETMGGEFYQLAIPVVRLGGDYDQ